MQGIYAIVNRVNGKRYIGSSADFDVRWREHRRHLRGLRHVNPKLQAAWNKHGAEAFEFVALEIVDDLARLLDREQVYLDAAGQTGYNICLCAGKGPNPLGSTHSLATRAKMSASQRGKTMSCDVREKIRASLVGKKHTAQRRANQSAAKIGRPGHHNGGHIPSLETRAKMSAAHRNRRATPETRERMRAAWVIRRHQSANRPTEESLHGT